MPAETKPDDFSAHYVGRGPGVGKATGVFAWVLSWPDGSETFPAIQTQMGFMPGIARERETIEAYEDVVAHCAAAHGCTYRMIQFVSVVEASTMGAARNVLPC